MEKDLAGGHGYERGSLRLRERGFLMHNYGVIAAFSGQLVEKPRGFESLAPRIRGQGAFSDHLAFCELLF